MSDSPGPSKLRSSTRTLAHPYKQPAKRDSTGPPNPSNVSKNNPKCQPTTTDSPRPQKVYLRINKQHLLSIPAATADEPNPQPLPPSPGPDTTGNLPNLSVITADLPDLQPFAGDTVDWLIKLARFIFEPLGTSSLYTFTTGTVEWWLDKEMELSLWRKVEFGEHLEATIYEFRPENNAYVTLTKMSIRQTRSVTTNESLDHDSSSTFRKTLLRRDKTCIISKEATESLLVASHIIPRRLGDSGIQSAMERFTGNSTSVVTRYSPIIGVLLFSPLDILADCYDLGY